MVLPSNKLQKAKLPLEFKGMNFASKNSKKDRSADPLKYLETGAAWILCNLSV